MKNRGSIKSSDVLTVLLLILLLSVLTSIYINTDDYLPAPQNSAYSAPEKTKIVPYLNQGDEKIDNTENPVINSKYDITPKLIYRIRKNRIKTLTINYNFTRCQNVNDAEPSSIYNDDRTQSNPFWRANQISPLKRIEFEIRLSPNVKSLACAFSDFDQLEYVNIKSTANVTDMKWMFNRAKMFNQPIGDWDTSNVTDMSGMFCAARSFNQPLDGWDTTAVSTMDQMFFFAKSFNQPLDGWNTSNVTSMYQMFREARSFNQDLNSWDTSAVVNMAMMFSGAQSFNGAIDKWNTSRVGSMQGMFFDTAAFNQPVGGWDTSNVENMEAMFGNAAVFNQPIGAWDTSNVQHMNWMFYKAAAFNQNLDNGDTTRARRRHEMKEMFEGAASFTHQKPAGAD